MKVEWKPIKGYENAYFVSNRGMVLSLKRNVPTLLNGGLDSDGYLQVILCNGKYEAKKKHRIVMSAFMGESSLHINHKNGIKTDNRLENLEYCTPKQNIQHAIKIGLIKRNGKDNPNYGNHVLRGRKRPEHALRMNGKNNPFYGKHHTEETKEKIRLYWAKKGAIK